MKPAEELAELWAADGLDMEAIEAVDITAWRTYQLVYFLDQVLQKSPLPQGEGQLIPQGSAAQRGHGVMSWSSQVARDETTSEGLMGAWPVSSTSSSVVPGVWEASICVVGKGKPGKHVPKMYGDIPEGLQHSRDGLAGSPLRRSRAKAAIWMVTIPLVQAMWKG